MKYPNFPSFNHLDTTRRLRAYSAQSSQPSLSDAAWSIFGSATSIISDKLTELVTGTDKDDSSLPFKQTQGHYPISLSTSNQCTEDILDPLRSSNMMESDKKGKRGSQKLSTEATSVRAARPNIVDEDDETQDGLGDLIADVQEFRRDYYGDDASNAGDRSQDDAQSTTSSHIVIRRADDAVSESGTAVDQNAAAYMHRLNVRNEIIAKKNSQNNNSNADSSPNHGSAQIQTRERGFSSVSGFEEASAPLPRLHVPTDDAPKVFKNKNVTSITPVSGMIPTTPEMGSKSKRRSRQQQVGSKTPSKLSSGLTPSQSFSGTSTNDAFASAAELANLHRKTADRKGLEAGVVPMQVDETEDDFAPAQRRRGISLNTSSKNATGPVVHMNAAESTDAFEEDDDDLYDPEFDEDEGGSFGQGILGQGQSLRIIGHDGVIDTLDGPRSPDAKFSSQSTSSPYSGTQNNLGSQKELEVETSLMNHPDRRSQNEYAFETGSIAPSESATMRLNYARDSDDTESKGDSFHSVNKDIGRMSGTLAPLSESEEAPMKAMSEANFVSNQTDSMNADDLESVFDALPDETGLDMASMSSAIIYPMNSDLQDGFVPVQLTDLKIDASQVKNSLDDSTPHTPSTVGTPRIMAPPNAYSPRTLSSSSGLGILPPPALLNAEEAHRYEANNTASSDSPGSVIPAAAVKRLTGADPNDPSPLPLPQLIKGEKTVVPKEKRPFLSPRLDGKVDSEAGVAARLSSTSSPTQPVRLISSPSQVRDGNLSRANSGGTSDSSTNLLESASSLMSYNSHRDFSESFWFDDDIEPHMGESSTCMERVRFISNQLIFSNMYLVFYACLIIAQFVLLIFGIKTLRDRHMQSHWSFWLDVGVTSAMTIEGALRAIAFSPGYFRKWFNIIDTFVICTCIVLLILSTTLPTTALVGVVMGVVRCFFQVVRMVLMLRNNYNQRRRIRVARDTAVDFGTIAGQGGSGAQEPENDIQSSSKQRILQSRLRSDSQDDDRTIAFMNDTEDYEERHSLRSQKAGSNNSNYTPPSMPHLGIIGNSFGGSQMNYVRQIDEETEFAAGSFTEDTSVSSQLPGYISGSPSLSRLGSVLLQHQQQKQKQYQIQSGTQQRQESALPPQSVSSSYFNGSDGFASESDSNVNAVIQQARAAAAAANRNKR